MARSSLTLSTEAETSPDPPWVPSIIYCKARHLGEVGQGSPLSTGEDPLSESPQGKGKWPRQR